MERKHCNIWLNDIDSLVFSMFGELIQIGSIFLTMNSVSKLYDDPIRFKYPGAKI